MSDLLRLILRNLRRDGRRTALTVASIAGTVFLLVALLAVYGTLNATLDDPRAQRVLGLQQKNAPRGGELPMPYLERLRSLEGIAAAVPWSNVYARLESLVRLQGIATDPADLPRVMPPVVEGVPPEQFRDFVANPKGVLMGRKLMEGLKWQVGDTVSLLGGSLAADFPVQIMGVLEFPLLADNFLMHNAYYQTLLDSACACQTRGAVNMVFFLVEDGADLPGVEDRVRAAFAGQPTEVELTTIADYVGSLLSQSGDVSTLVLALTLVICLATLLVLGNTLAMAARQRTRDLAILRALGFKNRQAALVVLGEALGLCLAGSVVGGLLAFLSFHFVGFGVDLGPQSFFTVGVATVFKSTGLVLLIGILAGLPASLRALGLDVVNTLRGVG
ncbi:MAG TPA: ABC transporter permease [Thermoanaerobaculia bacterium]|nr:ABC transporter permease [Thermoanaerobaculia bacterium]